MHIVVEKEKDDVTGEIRRDHPDHLGVNAVLKCQKEIERNMGSFVEERIQR